MNEHHDAQLARIEAKIDKLLSLNEFEKKLDILLADRLDKSKVAKASAELGKSVGDVEQAIASVPPA